MSACYVYMYNRWTIGLYQRDKRQTNWLQQWRRLSMNILLYQHCHIVLWHCGIEVGRHPLGQTAVWWGKIPPPHWPCVLATKYVSCILNKNAPFSSLNLSKGFETNVKCLERFRKSPVATVGYNSTCVTLLPSQDPQLGLELYEIRMILVRVRDSR